MLQKYCVSRDDTIYEAWPDVALTPSGRLVCVFSECTHHGDRSYTRIMLTDSTDRGRTWSAKRPLTEGTQGLPYYNCARIMQLRDGRLAVVVDELHADEGSGRPDLCKNYLYFSEDDGQTWSAPVLTPVEGIVPDKLVELPDGRWLLGAHYRDNDFGFLIQRLWYSDDQGAHWSDAVTVAKQTGVNPCEVSLLPVAERTVVALLRENSGTGCDCLKAISHDGGETWSDLIHLPLPGCHRPVAGWLADGRALITYRFMQGGKGWLGSWTQNFFAAVTTKESLLAPTRQEAGCRILPVDFDRSPHSDLGYSGWVQFEDGEIYIVNYIVDDAPKAQIRGYSLSPGDFLLD